MTCDRRLYRLPILEGALAFILLMSWSMGNVRAMASEPILPSRWQKIEGSDCSVWIEKLKPDETATGACEHGRASGRGVLTWTFTKVGKPQTGRYVGSMREGKESGKGTSVFWNGDRYEDQFADGNLLLLGRRPLRGSVCRRQA